MNESILYLLAIPVIVGIFSVFDRYKDHPASGIFIALSIFMFIGFGLWDSGFEIQALSIRK